jgi:hypothetical protein
MFSSVRAGVRRIIRLVAGVAVASIAAALTLGAPIAAHAVDTLHGCPPGYVCLYPQDAGWNNDTPSDKWYDYGTYQLSNQYGYHFILNNQTGGAGLRLCNGWNGEACPWSVTAGDSARLDFTPLNSIRLTSVGQTPPPPEPPAPTGPPRTNPPAQDSNHCHLNRASYKPDGEVGRPYYPVKLYGHTVRLYTNRGNASARAVVNGLENGDILSIDRSNFGVRGPKDHYWRTTGEIEDRGTWDYCEARPDWSGTAVTPRIDGAHRAVRVCLRHRGVLQCANWWYADNDDDVNDWF